MLWGLSQQELGVLLGTTKSAVCKFEALACPPSFNLVLATQVIFDVSPREAYPALYRQVHEEIIRRAAKLDLLWLGKSDAATKRKRQLLSNMVERFDEEFGRPEAV